MPPLIKQFMSSCGTVNIIDINELVDLLYNKHANHIMDIISDMAIDTAVLGQEPEDMPDVPQAINTTLLADVVSDDYDSLLDRRCAVLLGGNAGYGSYGDDTCYRRVKIPFENVGEDIKGWMLVKLLGLFEPYKVPSKETYSTEEVYDIACYTALENFINPTHIIKLNPKVIVAIDLDELIVKAVNDHGTIRMVIYTNKATMLKAVEANNELDF